MALSHGGLWSRAPLNGDTPGDPGHSHPEESRRLAYVQNRPAPAEGEWTYDAINEENFDDESGLRRRVRWFSENLGGTGETARSGTGRPVGVRGGASRGPAACPARAARSPVRTDTSGRLPTALAPLNGPLSPAHAGERYGAGRP